MIAKKVQAIILLDTGSVESMDFHMPERKKPYFFDKFLLLIFKEMKMN